jgi:GlcNAc-P-P-Und epimerase
MRVLLLGGSGFIGSEIAASLIRDGVQVRILDREPPTESLRGVWRHCDIFDTLSLRVETAAFLPTHAIYLAAETEADTQVFPPDPRFYEEFPVNTRGVRSVAQVLEGFGIERVVFFSTSFVQGPSSDPLVAPPPHTPYGVSKIAMEKQVHESSLPWTILRPTYVWGPGPARRFLVLADAIARRRYLHPSGGRITRSYGYVRNVSAQATRALVQPSVLHKTLFVGDEPENSSDFIDRMSVELTGQRARRMPRPLLKSMAVMVNRIDRIPFDTFRYRHMVSDFVVDMRETWEHLGQPEVSLETAMIEFGAWYRRSRPMMTEAGK